MQLAQQEVLACMDIQQKVISMQRHLTGSNTYAVVYYLILHPDDHILTKNFILGMVYFIEMLNLKIY